MGRPYFKKTLRSSRMVIYEGQLLSRVILMNNVAVVFPCRGEVVHKFKLRRVHRC